MSNLFTNGLFGNFLNTFEIVFTQKIPQVDSHKIFNFVSYHINSHSTLNCTYPWGSSPFSHNQAFRWNSSHYHKGNVILIHKSHFMPSILWCLCNTFLFTLIMSNNQRWMWNNNLWHQMHLGPLVPWLGCSLIGHCKCFQFSDKKGHISRTSCNKWGYHTIYTLCLCILCI
jgi:hypothetical protein